MAAAHKLWGEFEDDDRDETVIQTVNFNPIIELGMQNIPEIPITVKTSPTEFPKDNLIMHTIQLHAYLRQLTATYEQAINENARVDPMSIPPIPPETSEKPKHEANLPINFLPKDYCDFSLGKGSVVLPFTPESHERALKHCAAIALAHIGFSTCTHSALIAVSDALDFYINNMCRLMRSVADREASNLGSGFPDIITKVFADLNVGNLTQFYDNRIVNYHARVKKKCERIKAKCEFMAMGNIAPQQLKLEEVPEIHFPAALDGTFTPSLEPGFQMLQSLEQEQLQGLELLDAVNVDDIKIETMEYSQPESCSSLSLPSLSPSSKKKIRK